MCVKELENGIGICKTCELTERFKSRTRTVRFFVKRFRKLSSRTNTRTGIAMRYFSWMITRCVRTDCIPIKLCREKERG